MKSILALLLIFATVSCATPMKPVAQSERFDTEMGFTLLPPSGGPWYRVQTPDGTGYVLGREPSAEDKVDGSTVMTEVRYGFINLVELKLKNSKDTLSMFEKDMKHPDNTSRVENSKNDFVRIKFKNADCMTFDQTGVDKQAKSRQGEPMVMAYRGLLCLHPQDQGRYIRMSISQRRPASRKLTDMTTSEKAFYDTLEFAPLKGKAP